MSKKYQQSHILPAVWGNQDDKYWWNCIPTCCNQRQGKRKQHLTEDQVEKDTRSEHMFVALLEKGRIEACRKIAHQFFKHLLTLGEIRPTDVIGADSLLGFTLGFYCIETNPDIHDIWDFLKLKENEIKDARAIVHDHPRSK
jgi:hypothetical protein